MALRGTLKDFGIADIFQLIGHQTKSGLLRLKNRESEVTIFFREGNVVRAESATRRKKELLGELLLRGEIIDQSALDAALDDQRRTLRKLGDILISRGHLTKELLTEFMRLQTTETIYRLFSWQSGTYEFEQTEVERDPDFGDPLRAESVLMEGFRMVDEWPAIRKRITGYGLFFERANDLPLAQNDDDDLDFGEAPAKPKVDKSIGEAERRIFDLVDHERDVQALIDLSRLGEFETCKALFVLVGGGYLTIKGGDKRAKNPPILEGSLSIGPKRAGLVWALLLVALSSAAAFFVVKANALPSPSGSRARGIPDAMKMALCETQRRRLTRALEVFRLDRAHYPETLDDLVSAGLIEASDLVFPLGRPFIYRHDADKDFYELAPDLP